jgi:hypoxanthine phosphoribosyltransferase
MLIIPKSIFNNSSVTPRTKIIVDDAITKLLCTKLNLPSELFIRSIEYLPTFARDDFDEKILKNLYIRLLASNNFKVLTFDEIENSGATWEEVSEFLDYSGSKKITPEEFFDIRF